MDNLLQGRRIALRMPDHEKDHRLYERWSFDREFMHLWGAGPVTPLSEAVQKEFLENGMQACAVFNICTREDGHVIGQVDLSEFDAVTGNAWLGIGIGERAFWNNGYGSEAMEVLMRYGFEVLGLQRISLSVFEHNPRALHVYQKLGFVEEGRVRGFLERDGRRWDLIFFGLLREEWASRRIALV
ncbi:MAG: GNAT family N-acetyltransferase [Chloroflexi bacterium]|nr:GNAT family N-acetyltransferase [Chloroflexota bacterium]